MISFKLYPRLQSDIDPMRIGANFRNLSQTRGHCEITRLSLKTHLFDSNLSCWTFFMSRTMQLHYDSNEDRGRRSIIGPSKPVCSSLCCRQFITITIQAPFAPWDWVPSARSCLQGRGCLLPNQDPTQLYQRESIGPTFFCEKRAQVDDLRKYHVEADIKRKPYRRSKAFLNRFFLCSLKRVRIQRRIYYDNID